MFGAETEALFAKYCLDIWLHMLKQISSEGQKSIFSVHCPAYLNYLWLVLTKKSKNNSIDFMELRSE